MGASKDKTKECLELTNKDLILSESGFISRSIICYKFCFVFCFVSSHQSNSQSIGQINFDLSRKQNKTTNNNNKK